MHQRLQVNSQQHHVPTILLQLYTVNTMEYTLWYTVPCTVDTRYSTQYTAHYYTQYEYTDYSSKHTQYVVHSIFYTVHHTLHDIDQTELTIHCNIVITIHSTKYNYIEHSATNQQVSAK